SRPFTFGAVYRTHLSYSQPTTMEYDLLCALLLGFGNMFLFMGYDTHLTIVEPVLHSVHDRYPDSVSAHAGFYGCGLSTLIFMITTFISPYVLSILGSKYTLLLGSLLYTIHLASFQYIHYLPYYLTSAALGFGNALFYSGNGGYLTEHSTKNTIQRNSAVTWGLATSCLIAGGGMLVATARKHPSIGEHSENSTLIMPDTGILNGTTSAAHKPKSYRQFSDDEIRIMYGAFAGVLFLSNVVYAIMPTKPVENAIAAPARKQRIPFSDQMKKTFITFMDVRAVELIPLMFLIGLSTSFFVGAYPASLVFSNSLTGFIYLPALHLAMISVGEILMSLIISVAVPRINNFAQLPSLFFGSALFFIAMVLSVLSTPPEAINSPSNTPTPLLEPSPYICLIISLLLGMSDNTFNTSRSVLCALVIPDGIAQVYSMSRFFQALASSIVYLCLPMMSMPLYAGIVSLNCLLAVFFYWRAGKRLRRTEEKAERSAGSLDSARC
ncbi:hypothetical protein PENTCL1PPCAC_14221, partial [Pristionchus entomophagus]